MITILSIFKTSICVVFILVKLFFFLSIFKSKPILSDKQTEVMNLNEMKKCTNRYLDQSEAVKKINGIGIDPQVIIQRQREEIKKLRAKLRRYQKMMDELVAILNEDETHEHETRNVKKRKKSIYQEFHRKKRKKSVF